MKEKELEKLLYRERIRVEVSQIFPKQVEMLVDMVNYGSNLIARAYDSSNKKLEDIIVIVVLLKQVVSMIDSIEVLASQGIVRPAFLQVRSAFEASLYIDWILKSESNKKAKYYYVSNLRNTRFWALRILEGTRENLDFKQLMADMKDILDPRLIPLEYKELAKKQITEVERILKQENYSSINSEFEKRYNKTNGVDIIWYRLLGIDSIMKLAEEVDRLPEYVVFYTRGSELMHTKLYRDQVKFKKGIIIFEPIRHLEDMNRLLHYTISISLSAYLSIIKHYREGESDNFAKKFKNDWQQTYQHIPAVTYKEK